MSFGGRRIEHRLFSFLTMNWRGKPLVSVEAIIELIGNITQKMLEPVTRGRSVVGMKQFAKAVYRSEDQHGSSEATFGNVS